MSSWYFTRRRGELFLGWLRVGVAFLTSAAVLYDSKLELASWVRMFSFAYAVGSVLALVFSALRVPTLRTRVVQHVADCALSLALIVGLSSSAALFLTHFVFLIAAAALRFRWSAIVLTTFLCATAYAGAVAREEGAVRGRSVVNLVSVIVIGAAAALVTSYQERLRRQLSAIIDARASEIEDVETLYDTLLAAAARAMRVPRVIAIFQTGSESHLCVWDGRELRLNDFTASAWSGLLAELVEHDDFFCNDARAAAAEVVTGSGETLRVEAPLAADVTHAHRIKSLLRIVLQGRFMRGSLLFVDREFNWDDLAYGRLLADVVASRLDDHEVLKTAASKAVAAERSRVARDLHDGLLQSLTGAGLQIDAARRLIDDNPADAKQILRDVQDVLVVDQNELRYLIESLRQSSTSRAVDLKSEVRFNALVAMVRRQWGAEVDFRLPSLGSSVGKSERREIHRLLREAVFNAAKHSGATRITVEGEIEGGLLRLRVRNDGRGFSFRGRHDLAALNEMQVGPTTLKERVAHLGGTLVIDSHDHGSEVEIRLPVRRHEGVVA